jgi:hypothetical protein
MMDRGKLKGYGALLLVFVLGVLAGGAGSRAMLQRRYARLFRDRFSLFEQRRLGALAHRLDLDDTQEQKVGAVMAKYAQQRRALERDVMDRCGEPLRAQKAELDAEIRTLLRPDQQSRYDSLLKDSNRRAPPNGPAPEPLP